MSSTSPRRCTTAAVLLVVPCVLALMYVACWSSSRFGWSLRPTPRRLSIETIAGRQLLEVQSYYRTRSKKSGTVPTSGPGPTAELEQDESSPLPCNGTFWRRFGEPWRSYRMEALSIAFKASKKGEKSLIAYGQGLDGVFRPGQRRYLALFLERNGSLAVLWRTRANNQTAKVLVPGRFDDGGWYSVAVAAKRDRLEVAVSGGNVGSWTGSERAVESRFNTTSRAVRGADTLSVDSGLYFGGVVDEQALAAGDELRDAAPFSGMLSRRAHINGRQLELRRMRAGLTDRRAGPYLLDDVRYDLAAAGNGLPAGARKPPTVAFAERPAFRFFPVAGAVSEDHVEELVDMVGSVLQHMPQRGIVVYDLGLADSGRRIVRGLCNTTLRGFRTDLYGGQMWNLKFYMWKPILVSAVLLEFGGVIYADSSIRFQQDMAGLDVMRAGAGFVGFEPLDAGPVGAFTHDRMLDFFGVRREEIAHAHIAVGTASVWQDSAFVRGSLLRYWFRCALQLQCMAPEGSRLWPCDIPAQYSGHYIGCHRYDQSALSLAAHKAMRGLDDVAVDDYMLLHPHDLEYIVISRSVTHDYPRCMRRHDDDNSNQCECTPVEKGR